ncbi:hypothetical protein RZS08_44090, partial [Arthrospira platensis SPKY1]|nr:hypothetical protein [Arthrospira platensis SPKY1]
ELTGALQLDDGSFLAAGYMPQRNAPMTPSFHNSILIKISSEGDLLWQRHYRYLEARRSFHRIRSLAAAPDGGFVMAGEVRDTFNAPFQQGWLLKVDEHGCLVPGC